MVPETGWVTGASGRPTPGLSSAGLVGRESNGLMPSADVLRDRIHGHAQDLRTVVARLNSVHVSARWDSSAAATFSADLSTCMATALTLAAAWDALAGDLPAPGWSR